MKIDRLFNKGITGMLALAGILCGCAEEEHESRKQCPLVSRQPVRFLPETLLPAPQLQK